MNSIINQNLGGEQFNVNLAFTWKARFKTGEEISQFDNGKENKFKLIQDRFSELSYFYLISKDLSQCFCIDLNRGLIFFGNHQVVSEDFLKEKKENIRLIYFRRHQIKMTLNNTTKSHRIQYFLGFQYQDSKKNNHKSILQIDELGNWILGD